MLLGLIITQDSTALCLTKEVCKQRAACLCGSFISVLHVIRDTLQLCV